MKQVFADTLYWVALLLPRDLWKEPAVRARALSGRVQLVTTDEVLVEVLAALAESSVHHRRQAATMVRNILGREDITVLAQSHATFLAGLGLYERRPDKGYSLTDCISMNVMRERGISDILTNDRHFAQEGFNVLIRR